MEIFEKIKALRESKKMSQEYLALELGLSQSQYSRRESGEIKFVADEVKQIAELLQTGVSELYGEEKNTFYNHNQSGGAFGQYVTIHEKLFEQYEARLKEKDELIALLKLRNQR